MLDVVEREYEILPRLPLVAREAPIEVFSG
jgi:hypothetical protein